MTAQSKLTVLKFGSSVLRSEEDLPRAVHEIYRHWRRGERVLVVVSAFGDTTDRLFSHADSYYGPPEPSALAALLATGEATTAALLSLALDRAGLPVRVLAPEQAGLLTCGERLDAELIAVNILRLNDELRRAVVVLPGFVGRDETGGTTLLGRGGSDFTALYLAHQLGGHCVLVKDVDGFYTEDPMRAGACADRYESVSWETAYRVGGALVQPKAIRFAEARGLHFTIAAAGAHIGTEVGPGPDRLAPPRNAAAPLNVALIGCGTVGGGVYQRLAALPEFFNVTGVATRNPDRAVNAGVPAHLLTNDSATLIAQPCDVIVELIGGTEVASELLTDALRLGRHVVSANKALMASAGPTLERLAAECGVSLRYSAAVGGAMPALEAVSRAAISSPLRAISGVLNGTTNFILDQLADGGDFADAVRGAQAAGFAEADPRLDLNGTDAAQKLIILARAAFDVDLSLADIAREGIEGIDAGRVRRALDEGQRIRLVAECWRTMRGVEARVAPVALDWNHPLASTSGVENCLLIEPENGESLLISGKGAGRWPTSEAALADLFDLWRDHTSGRAGKPSQALEELAA
ncbi:MAG: homoserine dehydrogenase [Pyrinomonadaceae bacterium]|nr:homoserine dehydrogenase [Pyrinomonadaceae bacterium]